MELPFGKQQTVRRQPWLDIERCRKCFPRENFIYLKRVDLALFEGSVSSVVNENEEEVETAESDLENGEEVQSTTQVQTKTRNQKMEIHAFLNLTDGPLSY